MADFKKYFPVLSRNEGGYANDPKDSGGETWAGIARNFWPQWPGWKIIDKKKLGLTITGINRILHADTILAEMVYVFYKNQFWNSMQLDFVTSQPLAEQLCDMGVNAGSSRPAKMIQWLINQQKKAEHDFKPLVIDGDIGPKTIALVNALPTPALYAAFVTMRMQFYYFRVGQLEKVPAVIQSFFSKDLGLKSKPDQLKFLASWLSRCTPTTITA